MDDDRNAAIGAQPDHGLDLPGRGGESRDAGVKVAGADARIERLRDIVGAQARGAQPFGQGGEEGFGKPGHGAIMDRRRTR